MFKVSEIPSDTQMRDVLDHVPYQEIQKLFPTVFSVLQKQKVLKQVAVEIPGHGELYSLKLDGTGYFCSSYHHQLMGAAITHPDMKQVIPLGPEAILGPDGQRKTTAKEMQFPDF